MQKVLINNIYLLIILSNIFAYSDDVYKKNKK